MSQAALFALVTSGALIAGASTGMRWMPPVYLLVSAWIHRLDSVGPRRLILAALRSWTWWVVDARARGPALRWVCLSIHRGRATSCVRAYGLAA